MKLPEAFIWWQKGVIYEAYIRSFQDSNGDGIGDILGLQSRLPYLKWLGVDILWIPPVYRSPQCDFGYDISDYTDIDPLMGTMGQFENLLEDAHKMGIRIVLDIAPNHTSDRHPWFLESRSSRTNPKRNWYLWRDSAPGGGPPNNWLSAFGGSAWEWDEPTGQYYYHAFMKEQADLNWRNPEVERAISDCFRFWLEKGVDGFRIDVMWHFIKDEKFRDNPPNPDYDPTTMPSNDAVRSLYNADRPEVIDVMMRLRDVLEKYPGDRLMIGELYHSGDRLVDYYGPDCEGAQMPHNQQLILLPWQASKIRDSIERYMASLPDECWPNWVLGNHDKPRLATRLGGRAQARVAMMMLLTLRGTPTLYYGDELGMENVPVPPDKIKDPFEKLDPGKGQGRDPQRSPMQWDNNAENCGFSIGDPWLPLAPDWRHNCVEIQKAEAHSMLNLTRDLLAFRAGEPALLYGEHRLVFTDDAVVAYRREYGEDRLLVVLNLSDKSATIKLPYGYESVRPVISTLAFAEDERKFSDSVQLEPNEGLVLRPL